jgi:hypothetical protein
MNQLATVRYIVIVRPGGLPFPGVPYGDGPRFPQPYVL